MAEGSICGEGKGLLFAIYGFLSNKVSDFLLFEPLCYLLMFYLARMAQMKPSQEQMKDEKIREKWQSPVKAKNWLRCMTCSILGGEKKAPCNFWDTFHGEAKFFEDLPLKPPDYSYDFKICKKTICEHVGSLYLLEPPWGSK